jgi:hypothetical protein
MEEFKKSGGNRTSGRPLRLCANCSDAMIAATSLKYVSERCVRNSWSCDVCGFECETNDKADNKLKWTDYLFRVQIFGRQNFTHTLIVEVDRVSGHNAAQERNTHFEITENASRGTSQRRDLI